MELRVGVARSGWEGCCGGGGRRAESRQKTSRRFERTSLSFSLSSFYLIVHRLYVPWTPSFFLSRLLSSLLAGSTLFYSLISFLFRTLASPLSLLLFPSSSLLFFLSLSLWSRFFFLFSSFPSYDSLTRRVISFLFPFVPISLLSLFFFPFLCPFTLMSAVVSFLVGASPIVIARRLRLSNRSLGLQTRTLRSKTRIYVYYLRLQLLCSTALRLREEDCRHYVFQI